MTSSHSTVGATDAEFGREFLIAHRGDPEQLREGIIELFNDPLCPWCLSPLYREFGRRRLVDGAGYDYAPETTDANGRIQRPAEEREFCGECGVFDKSPWQSRKRRILEEHFRNLAVSLETLYDLEENGLSLDIGAGECVINDAYDNRETGEPITVVAEALSSALAPV